MFVPSFSSRGFPGGKAMGGLFTNKQEKTFCIKLQIKRTLSLYYNVADDQTINTHSKLS